MKRNDTSATLEGGISICSMLYIVVTCSRILQVRQYNLKQHSTNLSSGKWNIIVGTLKIQYIVFKVLVDMKLLGLIL